MRQGQEKLRISGVQQQKLIQELGDFKNRISSNDQQSDEFKRKIQNLLKQNESLDDEIKKGQEGLRLSTNQNQKLINELN